MIKYYHKTLRAAEVSEKDDFQRGAWVYVEAPTEDEITMLANRFKLEIGNLEDAIDEDEQPRLEREDGQSYIFVRFAYKKQNGEVDTAPLLIIFGGEYVITVAPVPLPAANWLLGSQAAFATTQRAKLVLLLLQQVSEQYDAYISQTSRKIKQIRSRLRSHGITNQDFIDFATIEDELNEFLGSLQPNNATLRRLLVGKHIPLFDEDQDIVEDILLNNEQSIEASNANLKSITNIRDAYSAISSNNLNRTITLLTIATVLIALPNVFFGMYGMNVHLPFEHAKYAFEFIVGINIVLLLTAVYFVRRGRAV